MEDITGIIIAIISAAGGVTAKYFLDMWRDARRGRLDQAQKIADQRDTARRERDQERRCKQEWQFAFQLARITAVKYGAPAAELPTPPDEPRQ